MRLAGTTDEAIGSFETKVEIMKFGKMLSQLRSKSGKSKYRLSQYSGIDQAYIQRLETGERANPSREIVMLLALALVESSTNVSVDDIDELMLAAGYAPLRRRRAMRQPAAQ